MPAILRIFVYQTDASLTVLGQCESYDQHGGVGSEPDLSATLCRDHRSVGSGSGSRCHMVRIGRGRHMQDHWCVWFGRVRW